jgi:hypothetical protein
VILDIFKIHSHLGTGSEMTFFNHLRGVLVSIVKFMKRVIGIPMILL